MSTLQKIFVGLLGGVVAITLVIGVLFILSSYYGLKLDYSWTTTQPKIDTASQIYAKIIEDLSVELNGATTDYVLKFYNGQNAMSSYIAVPVESLVATTDGKLAIAIYDGSSETNVNAVYIAEVIEDESAMSADDNPRRPPFIGPIVPNGEVCFYNNDSKIEECDKRYRYTIDWSPDNDDIFPPWQEAEALGPLLYMDEFSDTDVYVRKHTPIDIQLVPKSATTFTFGRQ
jgi:hypothetical protein